MQVKIVPCAELGHEEGGEHLALCGTPCIVRLLPVLPAAQGPFDRKPSYQQGQDNPTQLEGMKSRALGRQLQRTMFLSQAGPEKEEALERSESDAGMSEAQLHRCNMCMHGLWDLGVQGAIGNLIRIFRQEQA